MNLSLSSLILFALLSSLVIEFLISDLSHLLWIAILDIECKLTFEKDISCKLFSNFALILLFEVDESLLSPWHNDDPCNFSSLTSSGKIDLKLLFSGSYWEIFDKETKEHDRLLIFEVVHLKFLDSLRLLFGFLDVEIGKLYSSNFL